MRVCEFMFGCVCACVCEWIYMCGCVCTYVCVHLYAHLCVHVCVHKHANMWGSCAPTFIALFNKLPTAIKQPFGCCFSLSQDLASVMWSGSTKMYGLAPPKDLSTNAVSLQAETFTHTHYRAPAWPHSCVCSMFENAWKVSVYAWKCSRACMSCVCASMSMSVLSVGWSVSWCNFL